MISAGGFNPPAFWRVGSSNLPIITKKIEMETIEAKPMLLAITDTHLSESNNKQVIDIFRQAIDKAIGHGFNHIYHLGDFFDSRRYQRLSTLKAAIEIFLMFEESGIELRIIPGNHDKASYTSEDSYLDVFSRYSSVTLIRDYGYFDEGDMRIHMVPFFDEKKCYDQYIRKAIDNIDPEVENILLTHVAMDGVKNNDGTKMTDVVNSKEIAKLFTLTLVGHYHDYQELVGGKIIFIGSSHQHNFGEDTMKGLTYVMDNLSLGQESFDTIKFNKIEIDLNHVTEEEIKELTEKHKESSDNVRFKFTGAKEKVSSIDKMKFKSLGIDVKTEADEVDVDISYVDVVNFSGFDGNSILEEWDDFASKKNLDEDLSNEIKDLLKETLSN